MISDFFVLFSSIACSYATSGTLRLLHSHSVGLPQCVSKLIKKVPYAKCICDNLYSHLADRWTGSMTVLTEEQGRTCMSAACLNRAAPSAVQSCVRRKSYAM